MSANLVPITSIHETPENWTIYNRPGTEPEFLALVESVEADGITQEILVSSDNFIVSGHRRHIAATRAGLAMVPITRLDFSISDKTPSERVKILTTHNRGTRRKTESEMVREAMAKVDPEAAIHEAENRRAKHLTYIKSSFTFIEARGKVARTSTGGARSEFMNAVLQILEEKEERGHLPCSGRSIHYLLLQRKVRTSTYGNSHTYGEYWKKHKKTGVTELCDSSPFLYKLLTDARHEGVIDDEWISDETRPVWIPLLYDSPADYVEQALDGMFDEYFVNPHRDQDSHIEIMVEKNTIYPLIKRLVGSPMRLPVNSCRGYSSGAQRARVVERFKASGKRHLTIIYAGDHDPDGIEMPKSIVKYMQADLGVKPRIIRAAVTAEQIQRFNLIPDMMAKETSTRCPAYIKETGMNEAWEIDSMDPDDLVAELTKACQSVLDLDIFNAAREQEKQDDIRLKKLRAATIQFVTDNYQLLTA
jgi:hypothetical protein